MVTFKQNLSKLTKIIYILIIEFIYKRKNPQCSDKKSENAKKIQPTLVIIDRILAKMKHLTHMCCEIGSMKYIDSYYKGSRTVNCSNSEISIKLWKPLEVIRNIYS